MNTAISSSNSISRGVDEGAALGGHLALGAQRLEARLERVELCAQRRLVHRGHLPLGLDRHHRPSTARRSAAGSAA